MRRLLALLAMLLSAPVMAETNLAWVPASATGDRDIGAWRIPSDASLVVSGSDWASAAIMPFGGLAATAPVWTCTGDVAIGSDTGCPAQGFGPKSQVRQSSPPVLPPPPAWAEGEAILSWIAPTTRVDGSSITGVLTYRIETAAGIAVVTVPASPLTVTGLPAGTHCWRVVAIEGSLASSPSTQACKTITEPTVPPPPPPIPVRLVVPNISSVPYALVFGVTAGCSTQCARGNAVLGFAPVGGECSDSMVYRYRNQDYYRLPQTSVIWLVTPTANAAAACR